MFLRKNASSEMELAFQEALAKNAAEEQTTGLTKVAEAMDHVANASHKSSRSNGSCCQCSRDL